MPAIATVSKNFETGLSIKIISFDKILNDANTTIKINPTINLGKWNRLELLVFELLLADQPDRNTSHNKESHFWKWVEKLNIDYVYLEMVTFEELNELYNIHDLYIFQ